MKVTLYIAASMDGYIAGPGGEINWLSVVDQPGKDYGYYQFYDSRCPGYRQQDLRFARR